MNANRLIARLAGSVILLVGSAAAVAQEDTTQTHRRHVVSATQDGLVVGRVVAFDGPSKVQSPLSGVSIYFVRNGSVVRNVATNSDGRFTVDGLEPGPYAFIGSSAKGFVAYGVVVKPYDAEATAEATEFEMIAPAVSPRFVALRQIVDKFMPRKAGVLNQPAEIKTSLEATEEVAAGANRVLVRDGKLVGTVRSLMIAQELADTRVFLIQNDETVANAVTNDQGSFEFTGVEPGVYDFVAIGTAGFAAIGLNAVKQEPQAISVATIQDEVKAPGQDKAVESLDAVMTPADNSQVVVEQVEHAEDLNGAEVVSDDSSVTGDPLDECGEEIGCGAAAGSCGCGYEEDYFGGCGGGGCCQAGGFGGFGHLLEAALAAWVITELIDENDDDDNPNNPGPISPAN
jgi:hypothetical protein